MPQTALSHRELFMQDHGNIFYFMNRTICDDGRYKFVFNGFDYDELYDLQEDPHEMHNLAENPHCTDVRERCAGPLVGLDAATGRPLRGQAIRRQRHSRPQHAAAQSQRPIPAHATLRRPVASRERQARTSSPMHTDFQSEA